METADAVALAALAKAVQALRRANQYKDPTPNIDALKAAIEAQLGALRQAIDALQSKADGEHVHADLIDIAQTHQEALSKINEALETVAAAEHEHLEYAHVAKVQSDLDAIDESILELKDFALSVSNSSAASADDLRNDLEEFSEAARDAVNALAERQNADASVLRRDIDRKADKDHTHGEFDALLGAISEQAREQDKNHKKLYSDTRKLAKAVEQARQIAEAKQDRGPAGKDGQDGKQGAIGPAGKDADQFKPMGDYAGGEYDALSIVRNNGALWMAIVKTSDVPSSDSDDWMLLVKDGEQGDKGDRGLAGRGTRTIKVIEQAISPMDGYRLSDEDSEDEVKYYGYIKVNDDDWYIQEIDHSSDEVTYRYANGVGDYAANWTNRAALTYYSLNEVTIQ